MYIKKLNLTQFRNYKNEKIEFSPGMNILYGNNGQGKTNILESIFYCATARSHRTNYEKEMIQRNQDFAHIQLFLEKDYEEIIDIHLKKKSNKGIAINKIPIHKISELFGLMNVVMFSPEDLGLIKNGPNIRRKYIDIELCQLNPLYFYNLQQYYKILKQRNSFLKNYDDHEGDLINIWDEQLNQYGIKIIQYRENFIRQLNELIHPIHSVLTGGKENIKIIYLCDSKEEELLTRLKKAVERDKKIGSTSVGPHRDDIGFFVNDLDIRVYGSQGQQRTAALSMKLAEIQIVKELTNHTPILLLDDVLSELDGFRQKYLLNNIENIQIILTCTGIEDYIKNSLNIQRLYHIEGGKVHLME